MPGNSLNLEQVGTRSKGLMAEQNREASPFPSGTPAAALAPVLGAQSRRLTGSRARIRVHLTIAGITGLGTLEPRGSDRTRLDP